MKKIALFLLLLSSVAFLGFASGSNETTSAGTPKKVDFWYLWGGAEGARIEAMVSAFNAAQSQYNVVGLSVPDVQKIKVAIAAGEGPDTADDFSDNVASYASTGILQPLDSFISKDKYNVSDFIPAALDTVKYSGKTYALPVSINLFMLFYNKDLLKAAGIDSPPKTGEELLQDAIKTTKVASDGTIQVLGFPDFPTVYYVQPMSVAFGGNFAAGDGTLTPDNPGTRRALQLIVDYRKKFGADKVAAFDSSAAYLTKADPFVGGKQAFRIDGPWFGATLKNDLKVTDLNYGVAPLPYPAGESSLQGRNLVRSSVFYIPSNAKNKEGAWAFLSWLLSEKQMSKLSSEMGWVPARLSSLDSPLFANVPDFKAFAATAKSPNLQTFPAIPTQAEYGKIISDAADSAMLMSTSVESALQAAQKKAAALK